MPLRLQLRVGFRNLFESVLSVGVVSGERDVNRQEGRIDSGVDVSKPVQTRPRTTLDSEISEQTVSAKDGIALEQKQVFSLDEQISSPGSKRHRRLHGLLGCYLLFGQREFDEDLEDVRSVGLTDAQNCGCRPGVPGFRDSVSLDSPEKVRDRYQRKELPS